MRDDMPIFFSKGKALISGLGEAENRDFVLKLVLAFVITAVGGLASQMLPASPSVPPVDRVTPPGGVVKSNTQ